jgi:LacI family repressor for deo operon, udp, cdd, tsx, nupC, and nupG
VAVTIREVARAAGVSVATVSLVLNRSGDRFRIAPGTQTRVRACARNLGYVADRRAQSLRRGETATVLVAFVARRVPDAFFVEILRGVEGAAAARGLETQVQLVQPGPQGWERLAGVAKGCAGTILVGDSDDARGGAREGPEPPASLASLASLAPLAPLALPGPVVRIGSGPLGPGQTQVRVDNRRAGREVAGHLLALGHREIAVLGPQRWYAPFVERRDGLLDALRAGGAPPPPVLVAPDSDAATVAALDAPPLRGATALVCLYDRLALTVLRAARLCGRRVPEDVSLAGFDDMEWSAVLSPALTTVHIPRWGMATAAVELLAALLRAQPGAGPAAAPAPVVLTPTLVVRESTGPAPGHRATSPQDGTR